MTRGSHRFFPPCCQSCAGLAPAPFAALARVVVEVGTAEVDIAVGLGFDELAASFVALALERRFVVAPLGLTLMRTRTGCPLGGFAASRCYIVSNVPVRVNRLSFAYASDMMML